jgi:hypothetical protein
MTKCEKWLREAIRAYKVHRNVNQLLSTVIVKSKDYQTDTQMDALLKTLNRVWREESEPECDKRRCKVCVMPGVRR